LELSAGQYRMPKRSGTRARPIKLVHNIVLSMPAPTPPHKVLAAAKVFAREKFGSSYRYAMVLHTHQQHPHVHLVVKAEDEFGRRRLRIDKAMLREWREDFARTMREQGVPANATSRSARGETKRALRDAAYRAIRGGRSDSIRAKVQSIAAELSATRAIRDPARGRLLETRNAVVTGWMGIAATLDAQGEIVLAGDVRCFASHLPKVLTDRERLAQDFLTFVNRQKSKNREKELVRDPMLERTR
jgi:relaxase-like protein